MTNLNDQLKLLREDQNLTQLDVAMKIDVGYSTYRKYETTNIMPKTKEVMALANLYNVSVDELLGLNERRNKMDLPNKTEFIVNLLRRDPATIAKLAATIADGRLDFVQSMRYRRLEQYFQGVREVEDDLGAACELSSKLFSDEKHKKESAERIFLLVSEINTETKVDYLINCTKSFLLGLISIESMFRIFRAISNALPEDLEYLKGHATSVEPIKGDMNVLALAQNGLMIQSGIDGNKGVEEQEYVISSLGFDVDEYALSLYDEERQNWYNSNGHQRDKKLDTAKPLSEEDIDSICT